MKNTQRNELAVCGFATVKTLEKIQRLYLVKEKAPLFGALCKKLATTKRPYNLVAPKDLERLCESVHHQGVVAMIEAPQIMPLTSDVTNFWIATGENALILDRIGNANNLGAIIRSAAFFAIKNIVIPLDESQSSITTSSYRVAQGGMEFVNIFSVRSIPFLLRSMKGKMTRIGTCLDANESVKNLKRLCYKKPALVVLGNEESGISGDVKSNCDNLIVIPRVPQQEVSTVESLNVAQAASIIMYELMKR